MAVGIGITDALRFWVYLALLCVQRQMELDSCPLGSSVGISQGHISDTTSTSWPESLDLWKGTRKAGSVAFSKALSPHCSQLAMGIRAQFQLPGDVSPKATPKLGF